MDRLRTRIRTLRADLRSEFEDALNRRYTPKQVAGSFALGVFITSLPTFGLGVLSFFLIVSVFGGVSKLALFASVLVLNPVVKWGVYGASFWLGSYILGPVEGVVSADVSFAAAPEIVIRLLVGNLLLAVVFTMIAYVVAYRLTMEYRRRQDDLTVVEEIVEDTIEKLPEP